MFVFRNIRGVAAVTAPQVSDYTPQRMRGMAMHDGPVRLALDVLKITYFVLLVHWNTILIANVMCCLDCNGGQCIDFERLQN